MLDKQGSTPMPSGQAELNAMPAMLLGHADAAAGDENQRLHTLAAYGLTSTPSEADFDNFAAMAADLFRLPICLINLVGERHLTVKGRSGLQVESIPRDGAFCTYTILSDHVFVVPDLAMDKRFTDHPLVTELGFRFYAGAPLISPMGRHRIGTLCLVDRVPHPPLDERGTRLLNGIAALVMDRMELRRAEHRLRFLAHNDPLTGCANRAKLGELIEKAKAAGGPAAMVLLDLDSFKHVNDTLGHAAGDALLVEVGARLAAALAGRGTLGRLGGDEFAALLPGLHDAAAACDLAQALQESLDPPFLVAGREFRVGASAGVAVSPPAEIGHLLASADLALYRAKTEGRRQCRLFDLAMRERYVARPTSSSKVRRGVRAALPAAGLPWARDLGRRGGPAALAPSQTWVAAAVRVPGRTGGRPHGGHGGRLGDRGRLPAGCGLAGAGPGAAGRRQPVRRADPGGQAGRHGAGGAGPLGAARLGPGA